MSAKRDVSSEFASLLKQLQQTPDSVEVKKAIIQRLPEMKVLARRDPLALYRLAQLHPEHSNQYREMMQESALRGCTNAMLAVCKLLVKGNHSSDQQQISYYLNKIEASNDAYIKQAAREFITEHRSSKQPSAYPGFFNSEQDALNSSDNYFECLAQIR